MGRQRVLFFPPPPMTAMSGTNPLVLVNRAMDLFLTEIQQRRGRYVADLAVQLLKEGHSGDDLTAVDRAFKMLTRAEQLVVPEKKEEAAHE